MVGSGHQKLWCIASTVWVVPVSRCHDARNDTVALAFQPHNHTLAFWAKQAALYNGYGHPTNVETMLKMADADENFAHTTIMLMKLQHLGQDGTAMLNTQLHFIVTNSGRTVAWIQSSPNLNRLIFHCYWAGDILRISSHLQQGMTKGWLGKDGRFHDFWPYLVWQSIVPDFPNLKKMRALKLEFDMQNKFSQLIGEGAARVATSYRSPDERNCDGFRIREKNKWPLSLCKKSRMIPSKRWWFFNRAGEKLSPNCFLMF